jgi:hypothetical protein
MYRVVQRRRTGKVYIVKYAHGKQLAKYLGRGDDVLAEANAKVVDLNRRLRGARATAPVRGITFTEYADRILGKYQGRKPGTYASLKQVIDDHLRPVFGPVPLVEIQRSQIGDLVDSKLAPTRGDRARQIADLRERLTPRQSRC